jgi:hypothetical protein
LLIARASLMPCAVDDIGGVSNVVDIFNVTSGAWSSAALSVPRAALEATSLPNIGVAIFAGGIGTCCHVYFRIFACCVVWYGEWDARVGKGWFADCVCKSHALPVVYPDLHSNVVDIFAETVSSHPPPSTTLPSDSSPASSPSPLPAVIAAAAAATSGHLPRALELVQFLSIYCTSLSSRQQTRVSDFQVASFTHIASSKAQYCGVCPGFCAQPLVPRSRW